MIYAERLINHLRKEKGEGKDKMQENTEEQGIVREDNVSSISDAEVCSSLHLFQHFSSISLEKLKLLFCALCSSKSCYELLEMQPRYIVHCLAVGINISDMIV
jgi:hypothetical protein